MYCLAVIERRVEVEGSLRRKRTEKKPVRREYRQSRKEGEKKRVLTAITKRKWREESERKKNENREEKGEERLKTFCMGRGYLSTLNTAGGLAAGAIPGDPGKIEIIFFGLARFLRR